MSKKARWCGLVFGIVGLVALAHAAEYKETRELSLDADGLTELDIACGAGDLVVTGHPGADAVAVVAHVGVRGVSEERAKALLEEGLTLTLTRQGKQATLVAKFEEERGWFKRATRGLTVWVDLEVNMPAPLALDVSDGSGDIKVEDILGGVEISDGSGDIELTHCEGGVEIKDGSGDIALARCVGAARVSDGSGGIRIADVDGTLDVSDGSGDIEVRALGGDLTMRDGSGRVNVVDVQGDATLSDGSGDVSFEDISGNLEIADGSGSIHANNIGGTVQVRDGSGDIHIDTVGGDVIVRNSGSGGCTITGVKGRVEQND